MTTLADGLLYLIKAEPTLLPPAPSVDMALAMEWRRRDEVHACLRCGHRAQCAFVADTDAGARWLDMCHGCANWLRTTATPDPLYPGRSEC